MRATIGLCIKRLLRPRGANVLVIDGEGDVSRALVGEIMVEIAIHRELAGIVMDGAIRNVGAIALKGVSLLYERLYPTRPV